MEIFVNKNYVEFDANTKVNKNEFRATPLDFIFSDEYEGLVCKAVFSKIATKDEKVDFYEEAIIDNTCFIPNEVMKYDGVLIGVYAYEVKKDELLLRYSPSPKKLWFLEGSYYEGASTPEEIEPSQFEQYIAYLNAQIARLDNISINSTPIIDGVKIEITNSDGTKETAKIYNGEVGPIGPEGPEGPAGRDGVIQYTAGDNITISSENVISATDTTYTAGSNITIENGVISATDTTYTAGSNISITNGEISADLSSKQDIMQYSTIPTASSSNVGSIIQYIGTTDTNYTNGYFYVCVEDDGVYSWENINVQPGGTITQNIEYWDCTENEVYDFKLSNLTSYGLEGNKFYLAKKDFKAKTSMYGNVYEFVKSGDLFLIIPMGNTSYYRFIHIGRGGFNESNSESPAIGVFEKGSSTNIYSLFNLRYVSMDYERTAPPYYSSAKLALSTTNTKSYIPTADYHPATKKYVDDKLTSYSGYDATKSQILKNVNGTLTWVDEV